MAFESTKEMLANEIEEKRAQLYQISHLVWHPAAVLLLLWSSHNKYTAITPNALSLKKFKLLNSVDMLDIKCISAYSWGKATLQPNRRSQGGDAG